MTLRPPNACEMPFSSSRTSPSDDLHAALAEQPVRPQIISTISIRPRRMSGRLGSRADVLPHECCEVERRYEQHEADPAVQQRQERAPARSGRRRRPAPSSGEMRRVQHPVGDRAADSACVLARDPRAVERAGDRVDGEAETIVRRTRRSPALARHGTRRAHRRDRDVEQDARLAGSRSISSSGPTISAPSTTPGRLPEPPRISIA